MPSLIERWAAGDEAAGEALYRDYFARVRDFVGTRGAKDVDAEDIAQEALIAGLEGLREGAHPEQLTAWIMGIAKHVQSKRTRLLLSQIDRSDPRQRGGGSLLIRKEMSDLLSSTLGELCEADRKVLDLTHRLGLTRKEIAEKMDVDVEAIHSRLDRVRGKLRESLSKHFTTLALRRIEGRGVTMDAVRALRPMFREPVILRHLDDLTEAEAARRLAVPVSTLRARLRSAYELLGFEEAPDFSAAKREHRQGTRR
ncbi:MAG TPA: sigma-70 family RNA polymerase sigma factor [Planctomycetota bacterium]